MNRTLCEGEQGFIECLPDDSSFPEPSVMWYMDGIPLTIDDEPTKYFVSPNTKTLLISEVNVSDSGDYHCVLTNPAGSVSRSQHLHVISLMDDESNETDDYDVGGNGTMCGNDTVPGKFV